MKPSKRQQQPLQQLQQLDSRRGAGAASGAGRKRAAPPSARPLLAGRAGAWLALVVVTIGALGLVACGGVAATSKASLGRSTSGRARASPAGGADGPLSGDKLAASATAPGPRALVSPAAAAPPGDMMPAAGHHYGKSHGGAGKYYMYAESPKKGAYKAGFKRGNHKHQIMRKEAVHKGHAHGYFKWHDKKGKGSHKWELKHYDKKAKKHHY